MNHAASGRHMPLPPPPVGHGPPGYSPLGPSSAPSRLRRRLALLPCLAGVYLLYWATGCPFRYFTGLSCPGCGMSRAWASALSLDLTAALYWHPLFWAVPLVAALWAADALLRRRGSPLLPRRVKAGLAAGLCLVFLLVWALRLAGGSHPAVTFGAPAFWQRLRALAGPLAGG